MSSSPYLLMEAMNSTVQPSIARELLGRCCSWMGKAIRCICAYCSCGCCCESDSQQESFSMDSALLRQTLESKMDLECYGSHPGIFPPCTSEETVIGPIYETLTILYKSRGARKRKCHGCFCFYAAAGSGKTTAALQLLHTLKKSPVRPKGCMVSLRPKGCMVSLKKEKKTFEKTSCYQQLCLALAQQTVNNITDLAVELGCAMEYDVTAKELPSILILDGLDKWDSDIEAFLMIFIEICHLKHLTLLIFTQSDEVADEALSLNRFFRMRDFPYATDIDPSTAAQEGNKREDGHYDVHWRPMRMSPDLTTKMLKKRLYKLASSLDDQQLSDWLSFVGDEDWKPARAIRKAWDDYAVKFGAQEIDMSPSSRSDSLGWLA